MCTYRLEGRGVFRDRARAIGSKVLICSCEAGGWAKEDDGETSSLSSVVPE